MIFFSLNSTKLKNYVLQCSINRRLFFATCLFYKWVTKHVFFLNIKNISLHATIPLTTGQMFGWLFFSVVVLKHIISKRNEPLPWHKITIKITSVLLNGHVCNSFILFLFQISTLFMLINFLSIRNERVFRIKNFKTIFSSFYSDWLNLLLKNL